MRTLPYTGGTVRPYHADCAGCLRHESVDSTALPGTAFFSGTKLRLPGTAFRSRGLAVARTSRKIGDARGVHPRIRMWTRPQMHVRRVRLSDMSASSPTCIEVAVTGCRAGERSDVAAARPGVLAVRHLFRKMEGGLDGKRPARWLVSVTAVSCVHTRVQRVT